MAAAPRLAELSPERFNSVVKISRLRPSVLLIKAWVRNISLLVKISADGCDAAYCQHGATAVVSESKNVVAV